jgi:5-methylcytosine-specific restriction protein A
LIVPATVCDHIVPHKGDERLFWAEENWQSLCFHHHSEKTAQEDGGFGRPIRPKPT